MLSPILIGISSSSFVCVDTVLVGEVLFSLTGFETGIFCSIRSANSAYAPPRCFKTSAYFIITRSYLTLFNHKLSGHSRTDYLFPCCPQILTIFLSNITHAAMVLVSCNTSVELAGIPPRPVTIKELLF